MNYRIQSIYSTYNLALYLFRYISSIIFIEDIYGKVI
jgi:hypothetical protein